MWKVTHTTRIDHILVQIHLVLVKNNEIHLVFSPNPSAQGGVGQLFASYCFRISLFLAKKWILPSIRLFVPRRCHLLGFVPLVVFRILEDKRCPLLISVFLLERVCSIEFGLMEFFWKFKGSFLTGVPSFYLQGVSWSWWSINCLVFLSICFKSCFLLMLC